MHPENELNENGTVRPEMENLQHNISLYSTGGGKYWSMRTIRSKSVQKSHAPLCLQAQARLRDALVSEIEDLNERKATVAANVADMTTQITELTDCLLYTSPSPRD